jgi:hypothetical protein
MVAALGLGPLGMMVMADCEKHAEMCQAFGVEGYPTLVLLKLTKTAEGEMAYSYVPYKVSDRDRAPCTLQDFIEKQKHSCVLTHKLTHVRAIDTSTSFSLMSPYIHPPQRVRHLRAGSARVRRHAGLFEIKQGWLAGRALPPAPARLLLVVRCSWLVVCL